MIDSYYVNILNEGMIPWLNKKGPIYGIRLTPGIFNLLNTDPRVMMEKTTPEAVAKILKKIEEEKAAKAAAELEAKKAEEAAKEEVVAPVVEEKVEDTHVCPVVELTKKVENSSEDDEIDSILESTNFESKLGVETDIVNAPDVVLEKKINVVKAYTKEELSEMTKAQMKSILKERGYTEGPYAGKYHDTLSDLIKKVLETQ